jgi:phosphorylase kinase alpha/beta subunit
MIIHNERLRPLIRDVYRPQDVQKLRAFLQKQGTFHFPALETGLFPAAHLSERGRYTGYDNVWVRDNIHIAHAHYVVGQAGVAVRTVQTLLLFFKRYCQRLERIIQGTADPDAVMNRPHIRFDGRTLSELDGNWSHAQNDALGYFLWLYCRLACTGHIAAGAEQLETLGLFPLFFQAVRYWEDKDSGHWEETRKIEASSIGVVVAALEMMRQLLAERSIASLTVVGRSVTPALLDELITSGRKALDRILPAESIQPGRERPFDSALLFLVYPVEVVDSVQAEAILQAVETHLQGDFGIRRYRRDSFWCADYDELVPRELRTTDTSEDMSARDALVKEGEEAQWCVFDPVISTIYGLRYERTADTHFISRQVHYLNRSLGQLTGRDSGFREFLCPELYYLKGVRYIPNDVTPLLWTQANLMIALHEMERTAQLIQD